MPGLPPLIEEDVQLMDSALDELLRRSEAAAVLIIDKGGPLISQRGAVGRFDNTTISALAAGSFCATQAIAEFERSPVFNQFTSKYDFWLAGVTTLNVTPLAPTHEARVALIERVRALAD